MHRVHAQNRGSAPDRLAAMRADRIRPHLVLSVKAARNLALVEIGPSERHRPQAGGGAPVRASLPAAGRGQERR
jgi:hypothetical protein